MLGSLTRRRLLSATGAAVALGGGYTAFLPRAAAQSAPREVRRIAIMTPERGTDMGWNQAGITAARAAAQRLGVQLEVAEGLGYPDIRPIMRELAANGADLIIAHASGYNNTAFEIGVERNVPVAVVDTPRKVTRPGLVVDYTLSGHEGAYIAGALAARKTRTGTLGIVVSGEPPSWNSQSHAFAQGARSVRANIPIRYAVIGPAAFSDAPGGRRVAEAVIAAGADIIFGQGNGATMGMLQAITTARATDGGQAWLIDVIGDKSQAAPNHLLTSVLWDITETIIKMVEDIRAGRFGSRRYTIGLADGSVRLLRTRHITDAEWAEVEAVKQRIVSGEVQVPYVADAAAVRALMSDVQAPAAR
ncbi:MAG: BMP family protein [Acetobacteraceae bacterium]|nr:BMP family protein [Acetobacteraceae bacterium]